MKKSILLALTLISISSAFAKPTAALPDVVSCASATGKATLDSMLDAVEVGYQPLPLFNRKQEMVGYLLAMQTENAGKKAWGFNGIRLCGNFMGEFYYNEGDAEFAKGWISNKPKALEINQDEGTLRLTVQNYRSPNRAGKPESQLVRATFEAYDITLSDGSEETLVGKGEFFVFIPTAWLR